MPAILRRFLAVAALLFLPLLGHSQTVVRWDYPSAAYTNNVRAPQPGAMVPVVSMPFSTVQICATWTVGTAACTTLATTYASQSLTPTCPSNAQLTPPLGGACTNQVDTAGNVGAWLAVGTYAYVITTSYGTFGPYQFQLASGSGSGGNPGGSSLTAQFNNSGSFGGDANILINPTVHSFTAPIINGWWNAAAYPGGSSTATQVQNAVNALTTIGSSQVGPIIIPSATSAYNQTSNPMLSASAQGPTVWDFRATLQSGWPTGGSLMSNGSDECAKNWFFFPMRSFLDVCNFTHLSNFPSNTLGSAGLFVQNIIDGSGPSSTIQANDGLAAAQWELQGTNTSSTRTFLTGGEFEHEIQGTNPSTGNSVGTHMDLYDARAGTWNTYSVDNPDWTNISIGVLWQAVSQAFATPLDAASPWHVGNAQNLRAEPPLILKSKMFLSGTAAFVNGSNLSVTYVSGDYFNDRAMTNQTLWVCPTAGVDCAGAGGTPYSVTGSNTPLALTMASVFTGSTGTYYWYFFGNQYAFSSIGSTWFQDVGFQAKNEIAGTPLDVRGGGGEIHDTALTSCIGGDPTACIIWFRNPNLAAVQSDGTFPRFGIGVDQQANFGFFAPLTVSFTASISGTTLTVTGSCTGGSIAVGQEVTPSGVAYGAFPYGVITALGSGAGCAGTYTLSNSQTVGATTMVALGQTSTGFISKTGAMTLSDAITVAGATGGTSTFNGPISTTGAISASGNINTTANVSAAAISASGNLTVAGSAKIGTPVLFSALPTCNATSGPVMASVSDVSSPGSTTWGQVITSGTGTASTPIVMLFCDETQWTVFAK